VKTQRAGEGTTFCGIGKLKEELLVAYQGRRIRRVMLGEWEIRGNTRGTKGIRLRGAAMGEGKTAPPSPAQEEDKDTAGGQKQLREESPDKIDVDVPDKKSS